MLIISQFYGIIIKMHFKEGEKHYQEHIHVNYNEFNAIYSINGKIIEDSLPKKQSRMVEVWILIHKIE